MDLLYHDGRATRYEGGPTRRWLKVKQLATDDVRGEQAMRQLAIAVLVVVMLLASSEVAARADANWWTAWSRDGAGAWTPYPRDLYFLGRRECIDHLDRAQLLYYFDAERPKETVVIIPSHARTIDPRRSRSLFPEGPPTEIRCLVNTEVPPGVEK